MSSVPTAPPPAPNCRTFSRTCCACSRPCVPQQLAETLGAFAAALRNEGNTIGATIDELAGYLHKFAPQVPRLASDISRFASVAHTYSDAAPDLLQSLRNFTTTNRTLVAQRSQFVALLQSVTDASNRYAAFTETNSSNLITLSRDSLPSLQVLAKYSSEFPCLSHTLVDFIPVMDRALGAGTNQPGLHVTLQVVPARRPYVTGPALTATGPPRCPQVSVAAANSTAVGAALSRGDGIGTENSPQENQVIAELVAPSVGDAGHVPAAGAACCSDRHCAARAVTSQMSRSMRGLTARSSRA